MSRPKLIVFASGTAEGGGPSPRQSGLRPRGGGSGFENLATSTELDADIVAVVSNHEHGGVRQRAERLGVPFVYMPPPYDAQHYASVLPARRSFGAGGQKTTAAAAAAAAEWIALSGWLKLVKGLDPARTFNIHPALLSFDHGRFGGPGLYGMLVHEAVKRALDAGEITESGFSMHFVTDEYDRGPVFFEKKVPLKKGMTADDIQKAVNAVEHQWQPKITNMVMHGQIRWDGKDPASLEVPANYKYRPKS